MILTVSNHKGGVGKTTVSTLLAAYAAKHTDKKIVLFDVDHNRGSSAIFLSNKEPETSIFDVFQCYEDDPYDEIAIAETLRAATQKANGFDNLYIVQSSKRLSQITALGLRAESLKEIIEMSRFDRYPLVIIDSGTIPSVVSMCINACDKLLIPMMMSQQCINPTKNTIRLARQNHIEVLGLLPLTVGKSKWDAEMLNNWKAEIEKTPELGWKLGLLAGIPQSKTIVKADVVNGSYPKVALPVMEKLYEELNI